MKICHISGYLRIGSSQFPNNAQELTPALIQLVEDDGFVTGGFNFDAKLRRQSVDPADLYLAHIGGIDTLARALLAAADAVTDGALLRLRQQRYQGWGTELGKRITSDSLNLASLADLAIEQGLDPKPRSGRQELAESILARHTKY